MQAIFVSLCFFRANVFQVNLDNISFLFKCNDVTLIIRRSNSLGSIYKIQKETKKKIHKKSEAATQRFSTK